jgi:hypothetical protein
MKTAEECIEELRGKYFLQMIKGHGLIAAMENYAGQFKTDKIDRNHIVINMRKMLVDPRKKFNREAAESYNEAIYDCIRLVKQILPETT